MHEVSIAEAIVQAVQGTLTSPDERVTRVRLRVGGLAGVVESSLVFAFDVVVSGTALDGAELVVEHVPIRVRCPRCGEQELPSARDFRCPACGDLCGELVQGRELEIVDVAIEDVPLPA